MIMLNKVLLGSFIIIMLALSSCQSTDNRRIVDVFNSGEILECSYIESPPEERIDFERHEVIVSYKSDAIKLESKAYQGFLLVSRAGTIEPLMEDRHSIIYDYAIENDCDYIINEDLTYDYILRERFNQDLMRQMFGGLPFIMDETKPIQLFERENRDKIDFSCRAIIPDTRFDIDGNICDVKMFEEFLRD